MTCLKLQPVLGRHIQYGEADSHYNADWQVIKLLPSIPPKDRLEQPAFSFILAINRSDTQLARYRTPSVHTSFPSLLLS
jgi:hypothetical protein